MSTGEKTNMLFLILRLQILVYGYLGFQLFGQAFECSRVEGCPIVAVADTNDTTRALVEWYCPYTTL